MANELSNLAPVPGSQRKRMRVGRGEGSGKGKTAGKGQKGQQARGAGKVSLAFEGGQMPLHMRIGKRGFKNNFSKQFSVVKLELVAKHFAAGEVVTPEALKERGLVKKVAKDGVKVLGNGAIEHALTIKAHKFTRSAVAKIEAAGGSVEEIKA